jgi:2-polyprenyl-3-methyl-5-hydroxy-6-metoxy-1,4-benzoquinol methylase
LYTASLPAGEEAEDYDQYYSDSNLTVPPFVENRVREIVGSFSSYRKLNRLLDVGFGAGTILDCAADLGWEAHGIEVSKPAIEKALLSNHQVFYGNLHEAGYPTDHFDVVTSSEILEHLDSPKDELREIWRILRPGGLLWATTPSGRGISSRLLGVHWTVMAPPDHTQLYSKRAVKWMLAEAGFGEVNIKTHGTNPLELINHFRPASSSSANQFERVQTSYNLNAGLSSSPMRRMIKQTLNFSLNVLRLGDSLKIYAKKPC